MQYLIYSAASKEWFRAPGLGTTKRADEAHRYTREEAEREIALRYNTGCEMEPVGSTPSAGVSK